MQIVKRNGNLEEYRGEKITTAMGKAFFSVGEEPGEETLQKLLAHVQAHMDTGKPVTV